MLAARIWAQSLSLLPPQSAQYAQISGRINALQGAAFRGEFVPSGQAVPSERPAQLGYRDREAEPRQETWQSALLKTGGSMAFSILLFSQMAGGWSFAIGLVLLIFVHEMGHVVANWYFGIPQSAPIFLGIFGAVIFLRGELRSAKVEAISGIAGPVFGSVAALGCYAYFLKTGNELAGMLAYYGVFINLWNLMPMPPLDGGRTTAAITPWVWGVGILGLVGYEGLQLYHAGRAGGINVFGIAIVLWLLSNAVPRVRRELLGGGWKHPYYAVGWPFRLGMSVLYFGLAALLIVCRARLSNELGL